MSDLNISRSRINREEPSFLERMDERSALDGSIAVDSAYFGESRLLTTQRKLLHLADYVQTRAVENELGDHDLSGFKFDQFADEFDNDHINM